MREPCMRVSRVRKGFTGNPWADTGTERVPRCAWRNPGISYPTAKATPCPTGKTIWCGISMPRAPGPLREGAERGMRITAAAGPFFPAPRGWLRTTQGISTSRIRATMLYAVSDPTGWWTLICGGFPGRWVCAGMRERSTCRTPGTTGC